MGKFEGGGAVGGGERERKRNSKGTVQKRPIKVWDVHVDNIVISKLVKTKSSCKYLILYLEKIDH